MDNRQLDITSNGDTSLRLALELIWSNAHGGKATHFKVANYLAKTTYYGTPVHRHVDSLTEDPRGTPTLILLWHAERDAIALPRPLTLQDATDYANDWLSKASRGLEPDIDGESGEGWRVFTQSWGHVADYHCAIVAIQPVWALYGK